MKITRATANFLGDTSAGTEARAEYDRRARRQWLAVAAGCVPLLGVATLAHVRVRGQISDSSSLTIATLAALTWFALCMIFMAYLNPRCPVCQSNLYLNGGFGLPMDRWCDRCHTMFVDD